MAVTNWDIWQYFRHLYPKLPDYELQIIIFRETGLNSRNIPHSAYASEEERKRRQYYKFSHYNSKPCYIGSLDSAIIKIQKIIVILESNIDPRVDEFRDNLQRIKEHFKKNYVPHPKDSEFIYKVIKCAQKFRIVYDKKKKKWLVALS